MLNDTQHAYVCTLLRTKHFSLFLRDDAANVNLHKQIYTTLTLRNNCLSNTIAIQNIAT